MTKAKNKTSPCKKPSAKTKQSAIEEQQELRRDTMTRAFADPEILALFLIHQLPNTKVNQEGGGKESCLDAGLLLEELRKITKMVTSGDLTNPERIASVQIQTLHALFTELASLAFSNLQDERFEQFMRLALKAQSQCARTTETLTALKNPAIIAKQLNMASQQVVNNGTMQTPQSAPPSTSNERPEAISDAKLANSSFGVFPISPTLKTCREMR